MKKPDESIMKFQEEFETKCKMILKDIEEKFIDLNALEDERFA